MMKSTKYLLGMTIALCLICASTGFCAGIKARMKARLPQIVELKGKGIIGETNRGYLAFVTAKKTKQDVVAAENEDRKAIYAQIAKQQNVSIQRVEERRAAALFSNGTPGYYYQNPAGAWVRK